MNQSEPSIIKHTVIKLTFDGASQKCRPVGIDELPGKVCYLAHDEYTKQRNCIPTFKSILYQDVWPGIDVAYRGDSHELKYDIRVCPGADLKNIHLKYDGAEQIWLDKAGALHIRTQVHTFVEKVPGIYQENNGERLQVNGGYILLDSKDDRISS